MPQPQLELTDSNFDEQLAAHHGVTVIDFWAPWCGPCQMLSPILDAIGEELKDDPEIMIAKLMVDDNPKTTGKFQISSIPTIGYFKNGELVDQTLGVQTKETILTKIRAAKAK